jgi:hypothetical protein
MFADFSLMARHAVLLLSLRVRTISLGKKQQEWGHGV